MPRNDNIQRVSQFFDAIVRNPDHLDDICSKEFRLVDPDLFPAPFTDLASYKTFLSENPLSGWSFELTHSEPIGESVSIRYRGQGVWGGEPVTMLRRANLQFWDGRLQRYDGAPDNEVGAAEVGR